VHDGSSVSEIGNYSEEIDVRKVKLINCRKIYFKREKLIGGFMIN
jgi:hypothetical protein